MQEIIDWQLALKTYEEAWGPSMIKQKERKKEGEKQLKKKVEEL